MSNSLAAFIDSLKPYYPGQIVGVSTNKLSHSSFSIKYLFVTNCSQARRQEVSDLLGGIITKGLRAHSSAAKFVLDGNLSEEVVNTAQSIIYFTGESSLPEFGFPIKKGEQVFLKTHSVEMALDSTEIKRELWAHLKVLLTI